MVKWTLSLIVLAALVVCFFLADKWNAGPLAKERHSGRRCVSGARFRSLARQEIWKTLVIPSILTTLTIPSPACTHDLGGRNARHTVTGDRPMRVFCWALAGLGVMWTAVGCAKNPAFPTAGSSKSKAPLSLSGPGGKVSLGDPLSAAQKAFPAPGGATVFTQTMSFMMISKEGWSWQDSKGSNAFEAAVRNGKIVALAETSDKVPPGNVPAQKTISQIGKPSKQGIGKTMAMFAWDCGDDARVEMHMIFPGTTMSGFCVTAIGAKSDLALLGYNTDDPAGYVTRTEAQAKILEPVFKEAKKRAQEKARARANAGN